MYSYTLPCHRQHGTTAFDDGLGKNLCNAQSLPLVYDELLHPLVCNNHSSQCEEMHPAVHFVGNNIISSKYKLHSPGC